ncbi:MAG: PleD family two-component system response regulator [Actinomycetota bacterium]|nr:response regulator [Actinomycetota bacterium]
MNNPRILVVDDYSSVRTLLRVLLETEGYRIMEAADGTEALRAAESTKPDLVILDLMMPELDGEHVISELHGNDTLQQIPILVLSAKQEALSRVREVVGHDNVFAKPFEPAELIGRIKELIGAATKASKSPWKGPS